MTAYRYVRTGRLAAERDGARWTVDPADVEQLLSPTPRRRRGTARVDARSRLEDRLVAGDEPGAWTVVEAALTSGMEPADVHLELLVPALRSIGDGWEAGRLSVADEHRASAVAARLIGRLGPRFARRGRKRGSVLVGAPANEEHALPSAILSDLLRGAGFEVIDLGADTPAESFAETARAANRLVAVLIAVTGSGHDRALRTTVSAVRAAGVTAPILVGGAAIADEAHALRLGADGWSGRDARRALAAVEEAVATPGSS
jgi:methanogenic corrinoid protein MtbC1